MKTHNFKELQVWQRSRRLVKDVYLVSRSFPKDERFGLTTQLRRSAVSIPSNIAEGCGRGTDKQLVHFCSVAQGSAFELETQLILALDLEFLEETELRGLQEELEEIQRMIHGFVNRFTKQ